MSTSVEFTAGISRSKSFRRRSCTLALLAALAWVGVQAAAAAPSDNWESPFQAGRPDITRDRLQPLPASRCDGDPYNKCTFSARADYDGNGTLDTIRMMNGPSVGALVVVFTGKSALRPLAIASFEEPWNGSCYLEAARGDRRAVVLTCPESSAAVFRMRKGKPAVRWIQD